MSVRKAQVVAVCGPNGGGKDALCRCLAGKQAVAAGAVLMDGTPLPAAPWRAARTGLIVALANNRVFDTLTVRENLTCSVQWWARSDKTEALDHALQLFPSLRSRLSQPAGTLSGGEQQMVALARALVATPKVVVLEEPWLGLAPKLVQSLLERMMSIRDLGVSFLVTEESEERARSYADAGYELAGGCLRALN